jgi:cAMP-specific phosphodiesterase 4
MVKKITMGACETKIKNNPELMKTNVREFIVIDFRPSARSPSRPVGKEKYSYQRPPAQPPKLLARACELPYEDPDYCTLAISRVEDTYLLAWTLLQKVPLPAPLRGEEFMRFFYELEWRYNRRENPFHNLRHGLNVMHCVYILQSKPKIREIMRPVERFALLLAGLCHDVNHSGRTNLFEINSESKLALRYNDLSVLENHHIATTFKLLKREGCNFLGGLEHLDYRTLRKWLVKLILSTDNQSHFKLMQTCEEILFDNQGEAMLKEEHRMEGGGLILHCSDFASNSKTVPQNEAWSRLVNEEFKRQYRLEIELNLSPTPWYKDLDLEPVRLKNEIGFVSAIVKPCWALTSEFLGRSELRHQLELIEAYLKHMTAQLEAEQKKA